MQFLVTAYDGIDEKAMGRRLAARDEHLALVESMFNHGTHLFAAAITDDNDKMIGSVLIVDSLSRSQLDEWLKVEPYVLGKVWDKIEIKPCKVGPMFTRPHYRNW
ncbi:YciI family protein [Clostridium bowmanii]|uniref:YciI family protein n=1 Tax=Clostridium bowmanii TaxID=132925 RepID=UPI001C0BBEBA|nr:YciI family protein [Clostridium bowmanii]MBU3188302.1 hypothetical protein [Clostridium bowmanii]MCA1072690.1 YciI family protein [Clostridium bowmanii]